METFSCNSCEADIPFGRARLRCLSCSDYDSCADCHVIGATAGSHSPTHSYEIYMRGVALSKGGMPNAPVVKNPSRGMPSSPPSTTRDVQASPAASAQRAPETGQSAEAYWGTLITPQKKPSAIFSRLITAIFKHFATKSADVLQPSELCAFMAAAGYSAQDFPPLQLPVDKPEDSASPSDLHQRDAWLVNWYQSIPLDHRLATREFPPPPPVQPHQGRFRFRDQLMHAIMYPTPPVVADGMPLLTRQGLEEYFVWRAMEDPDDLCTRVNNIKLALPPLVDEESGKPFDSGVVPRECFHVASEGPDPEEEELMRARMMAAVAVQQGMEMAGRLQQQRQQQQQDMMAEQDANMLISRAMRYSSGYWEEDAYGNRTYHAGL